MKIKTIYLLLTISAMMCGCKGGVQENEAKGEGAVYIEGDTIVVVENSNLTGKLGTEEVSTRPYAVNIRTTGAVSAIPTQYAEVATPLPGRVVKSHIRIGQSVKVGSPLFDVSSSDYSEIAKTYLQSKSEMQQAERTYERIKDLFENHVASSKELDEAQTAYNIAREEFNHSVAMAHEYQLNTSNLEVGRAMTVRSPVQGKVLKNEIVIGEYLKEDTEAKVIVADLGKVWVKANISEKDASLVGEVKTVDITTMAKSDSVIHGKIVYVGEMLDPETRTLQLIIECENKQLSLLPNMYAEVVLYTEAAERIIIPKKAVLQDAKGRYVLRKTGDNKYCRTYVTVRTSSEADLIVTEGLNVGDEIVTEGAFYLIDTK